MKAIQKFAVVNSRKIVFVVLVLAVSVLTYREITRDFPPEKSQPQFQSLDIPVVIQIPGYMVVFSADSTKPSATFVIRFVKSDDTSAFRQNGWSVGSVADKDRDIWAVSSQVIK